MSITRHIEAYLSLKSESTERAYRAVIRSFSKFLGKRLLHKANVADAIGWLAFLSKSKAPDGQYTADATVRHRQHVMSSIFEHLVECEIVNRNPFRQARGAMPIRRHRQKRPTKLIPFEKVDELLNAPSPITKDGVRDRAILAILFGGGLRRSEALGLDLGDVMVTPEGVLYLRIRNAKGGSVQQQSLPPWAIERFSELVSQRKIEGASDIDPLFVFYYSDGRAGDRLAIKTIYRAFRHWCKFVGVNASPHSARATAATMLKAQGYEDRDVRDFLRHATTKMVEVYDKRARGPAQNVGRSLNFNVKK